VAEGINRKGRFTGVLTLPHNPTSLILPGNPNITTAANDRYEARSLGGGNWIVTKYVYANGSVISATNATNATTTTPIKLQCRAATTANITLAGSAPNTLDGVTLAANDRILVKSQSTASQNGIYVVTTLGTGANGTWTRATDADGAGELLASTLITVSEGTTNDNSLWMLTTDDPITIGTTALNFARKDDPPGLFETNGYQSLAGGLILQWGTYLNETAQANTYYTFDFPVAFPNAALIIVGSNVDGITPSNTAALDTSIVSSSQGKVSWSTTSAHRIYFIAIGY
jgi:phage-related tail fiber protein